MNKPIQSDYPPGMSPDMIDTNGDIIVSDDCKIVTVGLAAHLCGGKRTQLRWSRDVRWKAPQPEAKARLLYHPLATPIS